MPLWIRTCSNPRCKKPINGCFGTCKAGDILEWTNGQRDQRDVRELCPYCATWLVYYTDGLPLSMWLMLFVAFGWGNEKRLLPAPA